MHLQGGFTEAMLQINPAASDGFNEREDRPLRSRFTRVGGAMTFFSFRGLCLHTHGETLAHLQIRNIPMAAFLHFQGSDTVSIIPHQ